MPLARPSQRKKEGAAERPPLQQSNFARGWRYEHPVVLPHVSHFMQVPFRTSVKFMHSGHASPS